MASLLDPALARASLAAWRDAADFLDYAACEFADPDTGDALRAVANVLRDEANRRFEVRAVSAGG